MSGPTFCVPRFGASDALAPPTVGAGVRSIVRMSVLTVGLISMALSSLATPDIFSVRDRLKVVRVYAASDSTEVVKLEPFLDRAPRSLVREPMNQGSPTCAFPSLPNSSVAVLFDVAGPDPATGFGHRNNLVHQPFHHWAHSARAHMHHCNARIQRRNI